MQQSVRLLSLYLRCVSSWPENDDLTIRSVPSPYQVARKIKISANSSYKMWKVIFEKEYLKDLILMPAILPSGISRFYLIVELSMEKANSIINELQKITGIEFIKNSNYMKLRKGNSSVKEYKEIANIQFLSPKENSEKVVQQVANIFQKYEEEFVPIDFMERKIETSIPSSTHLKVLSQIAYKSVKNFSTEELTNNLSYSRKKARKLLDSLVLDRMIFAKPVYNFKRIPNMITKQMSIVLREEEISDAIRWIRSCNDLKNNIIHLNQYTHRITLTVFSETLEEMENISTLISGNFDEVYNSDKFETHFFYDVQENYRGWVNNSNEKQ